METNEVNSARKQCYKAQQPIYGNLLIAHNSSSSNTVLWNKYQIFIYENFKFESPVKVFIPEYQIHRLIITDNYLLCLDTDGCLHLTALKLENPAQKIINCIHQPRSIGIKACIALNQDLCLSLKFDEKYYISVNEINSEFLEVKKVAVEPTDFIQTTKEKCLLSHTKLDQVLAETLQKLFKIKKLDSNCHFILLSFDKVTVFGGLFDLNMPEDQIKLIKLYSCPSEICSVHIIGINLLIALSMGTVILLNLNKLATKAPKAIGIHMNSAIHKFAVLEDINTFVYSDGLKMWKTQDTYSEEVSFSQFCVNQVNDFTQCGDTFICTTFSKLIYVIPFSSDNVWLKNDNVYSPAVILLNKLDYMTQILKEVEKAKALAKQLKVEGSYLAAMSLSRRPDIMERVFITEVNIYNTFLEFLKSIEADVMLTEDMSAYFESDIYLIYVTVKVNSKLQARLHEVISNIMENNQAELHVTISNDHKILKTSSVKVSKMTCLMPFQLGNSSALNVNVRLVQIIPGTVNKKEMIWIDLYRKDIKLKSEHFMTDRKRSFVGLKKPRADLQTSILNLTTAHYGQQFSFTDMDDADTCSMYLRLPQKTIADNFAKYLSNTKSEYMIKALSSEDFLTSKSPFSFKVGKETVDVLVENDGFSNPQLKITSKNIRINANIRNFFSDIVYGFHECKAEEEFISNSLYTTVEVSIFLI